MKASSQVTTHNAKDANRRPFCVGWGTCRVIARSASEATRSGVHIRHVRILQGSIPYAPEKTGGYGIRPYGQAESERITERSGVTGRGIQIFGVIWVEIFKQLCYNKVDNSNMAFAV